MNDTSWRAIQFGTVVLWGIGIYLWAGLNWPYLVIVLALLHIIEAMTVGPKVGKQHGRKQAISIAATLVLGFTWWLPLKKGITQ